MTYDAIVLGGGLGGASLAKNLAERDYRVLVLERERQFKDRVRGEAMYPWGVSAARKLGIHDAILRAGGYQTCCWNSYLGGALFATRDLQKTSPHGVGCLHFYHPDMQEAVLRLAQEAGAEVRRGVMVDSVTSGPLPTVLIEENGAQQVLETQLVIGADGRNSRVRGWGEFVVNRDPEGLMIAGTLLDGTAVPEDRIHMAVGPEGMILMVPLGKRRARVYFIYPKVTGERHLTGNSKIESFLAACRGTGADPLWFDGARVAGPLAEFSGADHWVDRPARDGVVLTGDAAAAPDPCFGSGLSMTMLDVLHLRDSLLAEKDLGSAIRQYGALHDETYGALHQLEQWYAELLWTPGPAADERRGRVLPRLLTKPDGLPDLIGLGPASPLDDEARRGLLEH